MQAWELERELSKCQDKLATIKKWADSLTYSMTPEAWVEKMGDLNEILGLNDVFEFDELDDEQEWGFDEEKWRGPEVDTP